MWEKDAPLSHETVRCEEEVVLEVAGGWHLRSHHQLACLKKRAPFVRNADFSRKAMPATRAIILPRSCGWREMSDRLSSLWRLVITSRYNSSSTFVFFTTFSNFSNFQIFKTSQKRHHELNLEKRVRGSRSKANLEPRRPVSWTFSIFVKFDF